MLQDIIQHGENALVRDVSHNSHQRAVYELAITIGDEHDMDVTDVGDACSKMAEENDRLNVIFKCTS